MEDTEIADLTQWCEREPYGRFGDSCTTAATGYQITPSSGPSGRFSHQKSHARRASAEVADQSIDAFILAKLDEKKLTAAPPARSRCSSDAQLSI